MAQRDIGDLKNMEMIKSTPTVISWHTSDPNKSALKNNR